MIAECIIFLATLGSGSTLPSDNYLIENKLSCNQSVPARMQEHAELYYEFFDAENIPVAVRIGWCESRGKSTAHRTDNKDTGVMQFVPWTWNWVAEVYDLPVWDEWVITRFGRPYTELKVYRNSHGFEHLRVQYSAYWNIKFASILAEDIYGRTQWRDWNSSKWCWEDSKKWEKRWKTEEKNLG
tara:strand:+ start:230 stop:781 length:552 start_codon:yes stop_codon:yes gene_type:complete